MGYYGKKIEPCVQIDGVLKHEYLRKSLADRIAKKQFSKVMNDARKDLIKNMAFKSTKA